MATYSKVMLARLMLPPEVISMKKLLSSSLSRGKLLLRGEVGIVDIIYLDHKVSTQEINTQYIKAMDYC